ncbi:Terpene cyclase/mutase family member [Mycena indigotica]|uniref:Terpene cyclase/mutase family member n=1 Tax=Mycena indigotica TaxID=2126181 RepID=A0A8H6T246_9AGAR|nr:Terpene cyclase/mutase family member [Mycena indigotica]KAF7309636.1 Terpene cyclase/mutase family member [Mycena indigotica]
MYSRLDVQTSAAKSFTDYSRWRLRVSDSGRHTWHYLQTEEEAENWPQNLVDKFWLGLDLACPTLPRAKNPLEAAQNGFAFYKNLQSHDGHFPGEYGGPMFLLPGLVIGSYISGMEFTIQERLEMIRYLMNRAHAVDGGWGIHVEGPSTVFGTGLNYTALRILGVEADHPLTTPVLFLTCHRWSHCDTIMGEILALAAQCLRLGSIFIAGNNPVPPELWLLPDWIPFHPHRWWIHTRTVYIPMSYLYGVRFTMPENELILALREELYPENYYSIHWPSQRNHVAAVDLYSPHSTLLDMLNGILGMYESCALPPLRQAAIAKAYELIVREDENTGYQTLGPVSKMFNQVARVHAEGVESEAFRKHREKRYDFMWMGAEGMMMCGTNGSQLWDIGFIAQALVETGLAELPENQNSLLKVLEWLEDAQILDNPKHYESSYRHGTKGAWGFSTKEQGYVVSDCTGEGLKAVLYLQKNLNFTPQLVSDRRIYDAVDLLLTLQNSGGGFASYEPIRGPRWLELLNPAEVFGDIMIEYNYPECTTSVITSLSIFRQHYPDYRVADIEYVTPQDPKPPLTSPYNRRTIRNAIKYLHGCQQPEGGWVGSWGICFTYAMQFALESLALVGETYGTSEASRRACDFLIRKQREDGGWGESYKSCEISQWVEHENTQVVQTCWAAMALMYAKYPYPQPLERAVALVMARQLPDGSWAQEAIEGIFNKTCAIAYPNFKFSFPIWMLGKAHKYLEELKRTHSRGHLTA